MISYFYNTFGILSLFFAYKVVFSKDPVYSVISFVGMVFFFSLNLILLGTDFLGFLFLIVYAGAIIILFVFVLIMLNIRAAKAINIYISRRYNLKTFFKFTASFILIFSLVYVSILHFTENLYISNLSGMTKSSIFSDFFFNTLNTIQPFNYYLYYYPLFEGMEDPQKNFIRYLYLTRTDLFTTYDYLTNYFYWLRFMLDSITCISWLLYTHYSVYLYLGGLILLQVLMGSVIMVYSKTNIRTQRSYKDADYASVIVLKKTLL